MILHHTTLRPQLSLPVGLIAVTLLILMSPFSEANAQWTTPDASQNINNTNTGNVGIGTSTPGSSLEVKKNQNAATSVMIDNPFTTSGNLAFTSLGFKQNGVLRLHVASVNDGHSFITPGTAQFWNFANAPTVFATNNTEQMRISAAGMVGIGTNAPDVKLQVFHSSANTNIGNIQMADLVLGLRNTSNTNGAMSIISFQDATGYGNANIAAVQKDQANHAGDLAFLTRTNTTTFGERMRITSTGSVGIGIANPNYKLDVQGGSINTSQNLCINGDCRSSWSQIASQWANGTGSINYGGGLVGIGTTSPLYSLDVNGGTNGFRAKAASASSNDTIATFENNSAIQMIVRANGNVGIGLTNPTNKLHVNGSITVEGNINAKYQDVAEWVESSEQLSAGTVVVLDRTKNNQVVASTKPYDSRVAGVISLQPGIALGEQGEGHVLVATTGRVRVKVDASNGPIEIGDLLVTSDKTGVAMKSVPIDFAGAQIHRPGTLLGKALEPLAKGTGEILVLLSLQ